LIPALNEWNGVIPEVIITARYAKYYDCFLEGCIQNADINKPLTIANFNYSPRYNDFVLTRKGQCVCLERHDFPHIECPRSNDSGHIIIGKLREENILDLTAFKIPLQQTLLIGNNVIHTNDYQRGEWTTGYCPGEDIDTVGVHTYKRDYKNKRGIHVPITGFAFMVDPAVQNPMLKPVHRKQNNSITNIENDEELAYALQNMEVCEAQNNKFHLDDEEKKRR